VDDQFVGWHFGQLDCLRGGLYCNLSDVDVAIDVTGDSQRIAEGHIVAGKNSDRHGLDLEDFKTVQRYIQRLILFLRITGVMRIDIHSGIVALNHKAEDFPGSDCNLLIKRLVIHKVLFVSVIDH
jgi:hypothetical protein